MSKIKWSKTLPQWTKQFKKKSNYKALPILIVQILMLITLIVCIYLNWKNPSLPIYNPYRTTMFTFIPLNAAWALLGIRCARSAEFYKDGNTIVCVYRGWTTKGNLFVVNGKLLKKGSKDFSTKINNKTIHFHVGVLQTKVS